MTKRQSRIRSSLQAAIPILLLLNLGVAAADAQQPAKPDGNPPGEKPAGQEFAPRGQRTARKNKFTDWLKICSKTTGTTLPARTTITGPFGTGTPAVVIELMDRAGEPAAGLLFSLPVRLYQSEDPTS